MKIYRTFSLDYEFYILQLHSREKYGNFMTQAHISVQINILNFKQLTFFICTHIGKTKLFTDWSDFMDIPKMAFGRLCLLI